MTIKTRYVAIASTALKHIDFFVPAAVRESDKLYYGYRLIAAILLSALVYTLVLLLVSSQVTTLSAQGRSLFMASAGILALGAMAGLIALRFNSDRRLSLNIFILAIALAIAYTGSRTGGMTSPVNPCILIVPVLATLALGTRAGVSWSVAIFIIGLALLWTHKAGLTPPSIIRSENKSIAAFLSMMSAHIFLTMIVIYYNIAADRLRRLLDQERRRYQNLAHHDSLTGLANRRHFIDRISSAITHGEALGSYFCILYFDLNQFKDANDRYGHHFGDQVLIEFGQRLTTVSRRTDCVARLGGDEFSILLSDVRDEDTVRQKLQQISALLEAPLCLEGVNYNISASAGYAIYPTHGRDYETLLRRADSEMYAMKPGRLLPPANKPATDHPSTEKQRPLAR